MTEWDAKAYSERNALQKWLAEAHLAGLRLEGTERVLDIGCGDGKITAEIARRLTSGSVLGIDPSTQMIAFARPTLPRPSIRTSRSPSAMPRPFPIAASSIWSSRSMRSHWVRDQKAALRGIRAALKPTGTTFLEFVPEGPRTCLEDVIEETCKTERWAPYFAGHAPPYVHLTPDQYRQLASDSGLQVERLERELKTWDFGSRQGFVDWAKVTFVAWTKNLPERERLAFIDDVLDRYGRLDGAEGDDVSLFKFYQMVVVLRVA